MKKQRARKGNQIEIVGDVAYVSLTQGKRTVISASDVPRISGYTWRTARGETTCYAVTSIRVGGGRRLNLGMHSLLLPAPKGFITDHEDWDGLNNTRENLRVLTESESSLHRRPWTILNELPPNVFRTTNGNLTARVRTKGRLYTRSGGWKDDVPGDRERAGAAAVELKKEICGKLGIAAMAGVVEFPRVPNRPAA